MPEDPPPPPDGPDVRAALERALRHDLPFDALRGFVADPRLFGYVPLPYAVAHRILPLLLVGDTLRIAAAEPSPDLSLLTARFPRLAVDVVIAPGEEIDRALRDARAGDAAVPPGGTPNA